MITIDELMTANPYTLRENDTLEDARRIMTERHIRHIPITDDNHHLLGLVTQRDVLEATDPGSKQHANSSSSSDNIKLSDIMIRNVSVVHQSESVRQAAMFLRSHKFGCLPVVSNDRLVGIITDSDFIDIAINLLEQVDMAEDAVDYEMDSMDDVELPILEDEL